MPAITARAPAKSILVGEHAVVYNRPAIAFPINQLQAKTTISANIFGRPDEVEFEAIDIKYFEKLEKIPNDHPYKIAVNLIKKEASISHYPSCKIRISSRVPIASGMGSSASIAVSLVKGLSEFIGLQLTKQRLADLAYQLEVKYHGTPSGIDNTVIAYNELIYFTKGAGFHVICPTSNLLLLIANSGIKGNTREAVMKVNAGWKENPQFYETIFDKIGQIVETAEKAIVSGDVLSLGRLMSSNHALLSQIGVSNLMLDKMVDIAIESGAYGAKLSGGGLGGNMIAITTTDLLETITENLRKAGVNQVFYETIAKGNNE